MKKIMIGLIALLVCMQVFAQSAGNDTTQYIYYRFTYGNALDRYWAKRVLLIPMDTTYSKDGVALKNGIMYIGDGTKWTPVGSTGSADSAIFATISRLADSSAALRGLISSGFDSSTSQGGGFHTEPYNDVRYLKRSDSTQATGFVPRNQVDSAKQAIRNLIAGKKDNADSVAPTGYASHGRVQKVVDSLVALLNLKANALNPEFSGYIWSHGWTTGGRPGSPQPGYFGFNQDSLKFEYSDGTSWHTIGGSVASGAFNKYIYQIYGSPSTLNILDNTDVYVDGVHGNNANSGAAEALAKKTIASAMTVATTIASANSTARISIRDSSEMHETISPTVNGIRVSAYKLGYNQEVRLPIITSSDANKTGWSKTAGRTNIWQKNISHNIPGGSPGYDVPQVIEIDTTFLQVKPFSSRKYLKIAASLAACDTIPGSWWMDMSTTYANPMTIYIHTTSNDQPDTNRYNYDVTQRYANIHVSNPNPGLKNTFLENLILRDAADGYGEVGAGDSAYVHSCFLQGGGTHSLGLNSGTVDNVVMSNGAITPSGQISVAFYNVTGRGRYNKLINSVLLATPYAVLCHQSSTDSAAMEEIYLDNDYMFSLPDNQTVGVSADVCNAVNIRNCYIDSFGTAFVFGHGNNTVYRSVIRNSTNYNGLSSAGSQKSTLKVWNSVIETNGTGPLGIGTACLRSTQDSQYIFLNNSVLYSKNNVNGITNSLFDVHSGIANTTTSYNNIFIAINTAGGSGNRAIACISNTNSQATPYSLNYRGDNNVWIIGPGITAFRWNFLNTTGYINTDSLSRWQAITGQDLHSLVIDVSKNPLGLKAIFVDPDNGNWQLLPPGNPYADSIRAHGAGLGSTITSYPKKPTIEDAVYAMQAGGPPSFAARWVNASASSPSPAYASDATPGLVRPSSVYFTNNPTSVDSKLTTVGGPVVVTFSAANNIIQNNGIWFANNIGNTTVNYAVANMKIPAYCDGYFQYMFMPDSNCRNAYIGLSPGPSATSFGHYYIGSEVDNAGALRYIDGYGLTSSTGFSPSVPTFIRIMRKTGVITLAYSLDEVTWTTVRTFALPTNADLYPMINLDNTGTGGRTHVFYPKIFGGVPVSTVTVRDPAVDMNFAKTLTLSNVGTVWTGTNASSFGNNYAICNQKLVANGWVETFISADSSAKNAGIYLCKKDSLEKYTGTDVPFVALFFGSNILYYIDGVGGSMTSSGVTGHINMWYRLNRQDSIVTLDYSPDHIKWSTAYTYNTHYTGDLFPHIFSDNTGSPISHNFNPAIVNGSMKALATIGSTGSSYYQTVQSNGSNQTHRANLNFSTDFTISDNSGNGSTDVSLFSAWKIYSANGTFSGDGSTTTFTIAHGRSGVTSNSACSVQSRSADAVGITYIETDATNITIHFATAPPSGTNNVQVSYFLRP